MLIERAEWFIESFLTEDLTLEKLATDCRVSPFHLTRTFSVLTGMSLMRYVWRRRLTRAAERLARGDGTVLSVALDAGYASHEAFTRAFRSAFGVTPTAVRRGHALPQDAMTQPLSTRRNLMTKTLNPPKIEMMPARTFAGLARDYDMESRRAIPGQWNDYNEAGEQPAETVPDAWYGVCCDFNDAGDRFRYLCGVEVTKRGTLPEDQEFVEVPSGRYARFATKGHISTINSVWEEIYGAWLGGEGMISRPAPSIEFYPPAFDGRTGEGGFEVWIAIV